MIFMWLWSTKDRTSIMIVLSIMWLLSTKDLYYDC